MISSNRYYSRYYTYIEPVLKSHFVKSYGSAVFTFVALTVFILFAIKPTVETILTLQKKLANNQEVSRKLNEKVQNLTLARKNYLNLDPNSKRRIITALPNQPEIKAALQTLESTALNNQASVSAIQIQPFVLDEITKKDTPPAAAEIIFVYNLEGAFVNLNAVLTQLKNSGRLISIDSVSFSSSSSKTVFMSIKGKFHYLK